MSRFFCLCILAITALTAAAVAQSRDIYTVRGIPVDESAETVIEAQQLAFASAKLDGLYRMIARVTLPEDLIAAGDLGLTQEIADRLAAAVDVEQETRGAGRYRGRLSVVFSPPALTAFLDSIGVPFTDRSAPLAMMVPIAAPGLEFEWTEAFADRSQGNLAGYVTSRTGRYDRFSTWEQVRAEAVSLQSSRAVIAELLGREGAYRVRVAVITPSGVERLGLSASRPTLELAVEAAGAVLDNAWKRTSVIKETERNALEATVLYANLDDWNNLRRALAQSPLVSEFLTLAVAMDGAYVRFIFAGNGERLIEDLRGRGVVITADEEIGWVLSSSISPRLQER
ncbi:MAG: hypothetical protein AAGJ84_05380 [Pseudomonadota bacterium]